jgi:predicted esterase
MRAASLCSPEGQAPSAGVLFVHWYEPEASNSNRTQFQAEAVSLARLGVTSLSVETMWSDREWFIKRTHAEDFQNSINQLEELRKALALLRFQTGPEAPLAFVGHDFGAMYGVILGAIESGFDGYILMAGTPYFADWYFYFPPIAADDRVQYLERMAAVDPIAHVGGLSPAPVLFQFGKDDPHVPQAKAEAFFEAAQEPREIRWYGGGHALDDRSASDRLEWLTSQLNLG